MIIDLHSHLLPGIDDGAKDLTHALELARKAESEGITHLLVTPHYKNGQYTNMASDIVKSTEALQDAIDKAGINLTIFPGQEVRIHDDLLDSIRDNDVQFLDLNNRYLLLEFPTPYIPDYTETLIYELVHRGITPIIAHPERNHVIKENPNKMLSFIDQGCLGQVTAASYMGVFGEELAQISKDMIAHDLVHVISSDAHGIGLRDFYMKDAYEKLENEFGSSKVKQLTERAKAIVNGEEITDVEASPIEKNKRFFGLF